VDWWTHATSRNRYFSNDYVLCILDGESYDAGNLIVGGGSGTNNDFHGRIDDVAIFTRALSADEVALAKDQIGTN
jgi:hypothetical protein